MHDFKFKNNRLYGEAVSLDKIVKAVGTPVFVYSQKAILDHLRKLKQAFAELSPLICYSMKANSNLAVCRLLVKEGAGLDIVSGGELYRAKKVGTASRKIVYASVGKTPAEIEAAINAGILFFNVESIPELELINKIAGRLKKRQRVAIRINPDVAAHTHRYITTAKSENKFGIDINTARRIFLEGAKKLKNVDLCGIHIHIGSQIVEVGPFVRALKKAIVLIDALNKTGANITYLNIGGGLGIIYNNEKPQTAQQYAQAVVPLLRNKNLRLILEPGRFIMGNAGVLLTRVIYIKDTPVKRFIIVDAAMNDLIRPAFYQAYHEIAPLKTKPRAKLVKADVVGPVCESGDFFAKGRSLPDSLRQNDTLAIMSAGAYGFSMSSNYNSRPRAAEVLIAGSKYAVVRRRESYRDLVCNEIIVNI